MRVVETTEKDAGEPEPDQPIESSPTARAAEWDVPGDESSDTIGYFQLLTGLNPKILEDKWLEILPKPAPLKPLEIKAIGDPDIISRLKRKPDHR